MLYCAFYEIESLRAEVERLKEQSARRLDLANTLDAELETVRSDNKLLREALSGMLTHFEVDEYQWSAPVFNQAREALNSTKEKSNG